MLYIFYYTDIILHIETMFHLLSLYNIRDIYINKIFKQALSEVDSV